jgi:hypothetical protein
LLRRRRHTQARVVAVPVGVRQIARHRAIEATDLIDVARLQPAYAAASGASEQHVEFVPRGAAPLDEGGLRHAVLR